MIPELHATLQSAVTWRNQFRDRATLQGIAGCNNSIRHIENRFSPYFIYFFWFFNAVSALTSGGFRIVSDTLVFVHFIFIVLIVRLFVINK